MSYQTPNPANYENNPEEFSTLEKVNVIRKNKPKLPHQYKSTEGILPSIFQKKQRFISAPSLTKRIATPIKEAIKELFGETPSVLNASYELGLAEPIGNLRSVNEHKELHHQLQITERCLDLTEYELPENIENLHEEETVFELFQLYKQVLIEQTPDADSATLLRTTKRMIASALYYSNPDTWEEVFSLTKKTYQTILQKIDNSNDPIDTLSKTDLAELEIIYGYLHLLLGTKYVVSEDQNTRETGIIFESGGGEIIQHHLDDPTLNEPGLKRELSRTMFELYYKYNEWEKAVLHLQKAALGEPNELIEGCETLLQAGIPAKHILPILENLLFNYPEKKKTKLLFAEAALNDPEYLRTHKFRENIFKEIDAYINILIQLPEKQPLSPQSVTDRNTFAKFLYTQKRTKTAIKLLQPITNLQTLRNSEVTEEEKLSALTLLGLSHLHNKEFNIARNYFVSAQHYTKDRGWFIKTIRECGAEKYRYVLEELKLIKSTQTNTPNDTAHVQNILDLLHTHYPLTKEESLYTPILPPAIENTYKYIHEVLTIIGQEFNTKALENYKRFSKNSKKTTTLLIKEVLEETPGDIPETLRVLPKNY